jgi:hypothetical protein
MTKKAGTGSTYQGLDILARVKDFTTAMKTTSRMMDGLQAIHELRQAMPAWEADFVVQAREEGHSWQDIADALGVTRQSAWTKHHEIDLLEGLDGLRGQSDRMLSHDPRTSD